MIIETKRLILRPFQLGDEQDVYLYASNPNCGPDAGWKPHESIEYTRHMVSEWSQSNIILAIEDKKTQKVIGHLSYILDRNRAVKAMEIGYVLNQDYWNQGLTTEACVGLIEYCIKHYQIQLVTGRCSYLNKRSQRVLEKLGMTLEGVTRFERTHPVTNELIHTYNYSMTIHEFLQKQLEKKKSE